MFDGPPCGARFKCGRDTTVQLPHRAECWRSSEGDRTETDANIVYEIGFEDLHPSAVASSVRNLRHAPYLVAGGEYGYNVGAFLAHAFVDVASAATGTEVEVQFTGSRYAAAIVSSPQFDLENSRLKS